MSITINQTAPSRLSPNGWWNVKYDGHVIGTGPTREAAIAAATEYQGYDPLWTMAKLFTGLGGAIEEPEMRRLDDFLNPCVAGGWHSRVAPQSNPD
jgi:hypothetical protein